LQFFFRKKACNPQYNKYYCIGDCRLSFENKTARISPPLECVLGSLLIVVKCGVWSPRKSLLSEGCGPSFDRLWYCFCRVSVCLTCLSLTLNISYVYVYVKIRRHQHTRVHAHTGPRRHTRALACHRHHIPRLVRRQAFHTDPSGPGPVGIHGVVVIPSGAALTARLLA